jgi:hypothetical protein
MPSDKKKCKCKKHKKKLVLSYYLDTSNFIQNCVAIPTSNIDTSSSNNSTYFSGRSPIYDSIKNIECGDCAASFLCIKTTNVYVQIINYLSVNNGLVVSWLTPSTVTNLLIDEIANGMVTECIVYANTKIGVNPYYGMKFNLTVSSKNGRIYFDFVQL